MATTLEVVSAVFYEKFIKIEYIGRGKGANRRLTFLANPKIILHQSETLEILSVANRGHQVCL
jgi:hypothetical protein